MQSKCKECKKAHYNQNKSKILLKQKRYKNDKRKTNVQFKLTDNLRRRLRSALKSNQKQGSAVQDLGCTIDELKQYLGLKFQFGMSWDNYGPIGWHIDHIKPLASFDLTDRRQLLEACHYTNLQPLWAGDNYQKGKKIVS